MMLTDGNLRVEIVFIGEGWYGEFNKDNPKDEPLLRFYVSRLTNCCDYPDCPHEDHNQWEDLEDGSYCTCISMYVDDLTPYARAIMGKAKEYTNEVGLPVSGFKKAMEELSWLGAEGRT